MAKKEAYHKTKLKEDTKVKLETTICPKIRLAISIKAKHSGISESKVIEQLLNAHFDKNF